MGNQMIGNLLLRIKSRIRVAVLNLKGAQIDRSVKIWGKVVYLGHPQNLKIGHGSTLNHGVFLNLDDQLTIGKNVRVSPYVQLHTSHLDSNKIPRHHVKKPILIEGNVWLASGSIISAGVKIGENSVVVAGAVVTSDIPKNVMVGGVPAKIIKELNMKPGIGCNCSETIGENQKVSEKAKKRVSPVLARKKMVQL